MKNIDISDISVGPSLSTYTGSFLYAVNAKSIYIEDNTINRVKVSS